MRTPRTGDKAPLLHRLGYAVADRWWTSGYWLERALGYLGPSPHREQVLSEQYNRLLTHWRGRQNALGAALSVIMSVPGEEAEVVGRYRRAAGHTRGIHEVHLSVLLWYRDLVLQRPARGKRRRHLLTLMVALVRADVWPQPPDNATTGDPVALVQAWEELVTRQRHGSSVCQGR